MADRLIAVPAARSYVEVAIADPIMKATVNNVLDAIPAVDAVPVVRCKGCRFVIDREDGTHGCYRHFMDDCKPDDFCSYGERRCDNG